MSNVAKVNRLQTVMEELQRRQRKSKSTMSSCEGQQGSVVRYHGPYVDLSGERFFRPQKWQLLRKGGDDEKKAGRSVTSIILSTKTR